MEYPFLLEEGIGIVWRIYERDNVSFIQRCCRDVLLQLNIDPMRR